MRKGLASCIRALRHSSKLVRRSKLVLAHSKLVLGLARSMVLGQRRSTRVPRRNSLQRRRNKHSCGNGTNQLQRLQAPKRNRQQQPRQQ